jgi:hypothetical protein
MACNEIYSLDASDPVSNTNFDPPFGSSRPAPEDGVRLLRAFLTIAQPALREAIIELATRMSEAYQPVSNAQRTV